MKNYEELIQGDVVLAVLEFGPKREPYYVETLCIVDTCNTDGLRYVWYQETNGETWKSSMDENSYIKFLGRNVWDYAKEALK